MRRLIVGFIVRLIISTVISIAVWWLFVTPFDRLHLPPGAVVVIVRVLDFPVALAGEILPIRGMGSVFEDNGSWCDFCSMEDRFRLQMSLAIPVYLLLLYVAKVLRSMARRNGRLMKRIAIGLLIYALFTTTFFLITGESGDEGGLRTAAMWLLILAAAAAVAWSNLTERRKAAGVSIVLLAGAWALPVVRSYRAPRIDEVSPYYLSYLLLLIVGVGGTLWLTWAIEKGIDRWRTGREAWTPSLR